MLRRVLLVIGGIFLIGALLAFASGHGQGVSLQLLVFGAILVLGVAFERWRYKRVQPGRIEPHWQDSGERFVDPETGLVTAVYFDPDTSERHYVAIGPDPRHP